MGNRKGASYEAVASMPEVARPEVPTCALAPKQSVERSFKVFMKELWFKVFLPAPCSLSRGESIKWGVEWLNLSCSDFIFYPLFSANFLLSLLFLNPVDGKP